MPGSDTRNPRPVVLVFGGHDPTVGAGIGADIATLLALDCHPAAVITAVTVQNTRGVRDYRLLDPELVVAQAMAVMDDAPVAACKTGMLGSAAMVEAVVRCLDVLPQRPVVVDPVLAAGSGDSLAEADLRAALLERLLPRALVTTPNTLECLALTSPTTTPERAARSLLARGCPNVFVTGTHDRTTAVVHRLFSASDHQVMRSEWPRLQGSFHGSGCTLASALAAFLACGMDVPQAASRAAEYTWQALRNADPAGTGQALPDRLWQRPRQT